MPSPRNLTRQRIVNAALELFASQGVSETTTKQISELAEVNEVTLFRHFGNKHGLLLAVIEDSAVFTQLGQALIQQANQNGSIHQALKDYATACLEALERVPGVVRSVVGEAGQYPAENREALGRGFTQANRYVAEYLEAAIAREQLQANLSTEKLASLLNGMLLGYAVIEFTSEFHELWQDRDDFLENLVALFLQGAVSRSLESGVGSHDSFNAKSTAREDSLRIVGDLPAHLVHLLLQRAKKLGLQEYALVYVLFGSGLSPIEITRLERSHLMSDAEQQLLQVTQGFVRQVPVNQWIMGKRYGSYRHNPLTRWLKSRQDSNSALFLNHIGEPLSVTEIRQRWQALTIGLLSPEGQPLIVEQAQQTWCVEMLMAGMSEENLCILTGQDLANLQPYAQRAREKAALEQAMRLDRK
jgi:AcrR family transcriptional regulator